MSLLTAVLLPLNASTLTVSASIPYERYDRCGAASWFTERGSVATHRTLPLGLTVRVRNVENGASISVVINGRALSDADRVIALSSESFALIAPLAQGIADVCVSSA